MTPDFDPMAIDKTQMEEDARFSGYFSTDFLWFGASVPENVFQRCLMCSATNRVKREVLLKNKRFPVICPECGRKSMHTYDQKFWENYFTLKLWEYDFFADQFDEYYSAHVGGDGIRRIMKIKSEEHRAYLALALRNRAAIDQALLYLEGLARRGRKRQRLDTRVAAHDGAVWIDMCDDGWRAIRLNSLGWEIVSNPPVLFRRFKHMLPMVVDATGTKADFDAFLSIMNFQSPEDRMLYCGFLAQGFVPDIDRPILMPTGPQGSAKTTLCSATRMLLDPSSIPYTNMNKEADELPQKILHNYLPTFDNCTHLNQEISDMLCQASSGLGFSKRKLFTDMDDVVYTARRALILNGISPPSMAPDLLDRTIMIGLERITEDNRKEKREIEEKRDALLPKVRGYLLGITSSAMANPMKREGPLPRLADFARVAEAGLVQIGYRPGEFIRLYQEKNMEIAEQAVQSDPLAAVLLEFMEGREEWQGSASELLKELEQIAGSATKAPGFPKSQNWLSDALFGRLKPGLRLLGWVVARTHDGKKRKICITKVGETIKGW